jgi:2-amino-4-hydroxy-6-hydroxymethyldihydropteridine diphosphokinase
MARCLIGCGSNLGRRREQLDRAIELLRFMPGVEMRAVSRFRETVPVGGPPLQDPFLNGACLLETALPPRAVLDMLAAIENTLHRERRERWGPRTIDLDLLLYDDLVLDTPDLTLPHPRMATRRFVLEPAAEIARDLPFPPSACTIGDLLDAISAPHPFVAVVGVPGSGASEIATAVADAALARLLHAPSPWPTADACAATLAPWRQALAAWSAPLAGPAWDDEPHATVADYWCGGLEAAAADALDSDDAARFHADVVATAATVRVPTVAILLLVDAATLGERVAFRARRGRDHSDVFADLQPAAVLCDRPDDAVAPLVALQERLARSLRCAAGRRPDAPRAVITVDGTDLARASDEAIAAVEAML